MSSFVLSISQPSETQVKRPAPLDGQKKLEGDAEFWSVTTIIGVLDKPALIPWAANETADAAIAAAPNLVKMIDSMGTSEVRKYLSGARFRRPEGERTAAELGTAVHNACEQYALTGVRPVVDDEVAPFIDQFDKWCDTFQPVYEAAEMTVYSERYGYAGTLDAIFTVDGTRFIVDYKTTRKSTDYQGKATKPYPEQVGLQLAAYRHADLAAVWAPRRYEKFRRRLYLLSEDERAASVPVPSVDTGLVLHITPDHCNAHPIKCDDAVFDYFLHTVELARWVNFDSKAVMGSPLVA
jgi:hypothetical protein